MPNRNSSHQIRGQLRKARSLRAAPSASPNTQGQNSSQVPIGRSSRISLQIGLDGAVARDPPSFEAIGIGGLGACLVRASSRSIVCMADELNGTRRQAAPLCRRAAGEGRARAAGRCAGALSAACDAGEGGRPRQPVQRPRRRMAGAYRRRDQARLRADLRDADRAANAKSPISGCALRRSRKRRPITSRRRRPNSACALCSRCSPGAPS